MTKRRHVRTGAQLAELAFAAPQVMAHRLTRMAQAGSQPGRSDQVEFQRMTTEKWLAFGESWNAMALQVWRSTEQLALSSARAWWSALLGAWPALAAGTLPLAAGWYRPGSRRALQQWQGAALDVLGRGLVPVHRRAVANAKRLGRAPRR